MKRILIVGDSPDAPSGLARIGRDVANILVDIPGVEVAYAGFWGIGDPDQPFKQYTLGPYIDDLSTKSLGVAIQRFRPDILFTIYDPARLLPLVHPEVMPGTPETQAFRDAFSSGRRPLLWGYFPIDAIGVRPNEGLTGILREVLSGFERVLAYGPFGAKVIGATIGREVGWIPHGIDTEVFSPRRPDRSILQRGDLKVTPEDHLIGVVATNQPRKDWGTVFKVLSMLGPEWKLWAHTDRQIGVWSFPALAEDLEVQDQVFMTDALNDEQLATLYSSCDITFGPGLGEGFGYPLVESMACGTPCVHVNYAGGADLLPRDLLVDPIGFRTEGAYCVERPVLSAYKVLDRILVTYLDPKESATWRSHVARYSWPRVAPKWISWFKRGL